MDFIKPMINTFILRDICRDFFFLLFSLHFLCLYVYLCASYSFRLLFFLFFMVIFSLFLHSFITYLVPLLCVFILYFYFFLFSLLFTSSFYFSSWRTRLACILTVFISNLHQDSVYITFFDLDVCTNEIILSNFTIATAVTQSLLCRRLFRIYRFPKLVLIRV